MTSRLILSVFFIVLIASCAACPPDETRPAASSDESFPALGEFVELEVYPTVIRTVDPIYPMLAQQAGIEGNVWIGALVDRNGDVRDARVNKSSGTPALVEAAVKAAKQYKYKPGMRNGQPVACWVTYMVEFKLP